MKRTMRPSTLAPVVAIAIVLVLAAAPAAVRADASIEQKTQFNLAGAVGKMVGFFSKTAREGVTEQTYVKGDRKLSRTGDKGELIDLAEEKVYEIDFDRKSYTVATFEQIRQRMREQMQKAKEEARKQKGDEPRQDVQYEFDFDVKETGKKEKINGFDTREVLMTLTVRQKGKKLEEAGGAVLKADMWMGPKIDALAEEAAFDLRYMKKLGVAEMMREQAEAMAMAFATNPALSEAMKKFEEKKVDMSGSPVRTVMSLEAVAAPGQEGAGAGGDAEAAPSEGRPGLGGMLGKLGIGKKKAAKDEPAGAAAERPVPGRAPVFSTTTELLRAEPKATVESVAIPAGFKDRT